MAAAISTIAAFRDRWNIGDDHRPLDPDGAIKTIEAAGDRKHAQAATDQASRLYEEPRTHRREINEVLVGIQNSIERTLQL
jgi:hypothetical protein